MKRSIRKIDLLFETSWEVCNKIGGIYTVLSSKAKTLHDQFKDKLIFIGPDVWTEEHPSPYFIESPRLMRRWVENAGLPDGVDVRVGRWDVPGRPVAILVSFQGLYASKDSFYGRMWNLYGVDSLHAYGDYDEGCAFGRAAAAVIESIVSYYGDKARNVVAHFDEWTTGMGLLALKADMPAVATVFTTHATSIGRSICGNGKNLYEYLKGYNGDQMARELNMESKHSLEKAAAHAADCFTTVSKITADEAEQLLERRPIVTPNGFEPDLVPSGSEYDEARKVSRNTFINVARSLTGIDFDDDDTFIVATSGRCEYRNKGLDMFIDSIRSLSESVSGKRILAYILVPAWCSGPREDLLGAIENNSHTRLSDPLLTHGLNNYNEDPVNRRIHEAGFVNDEDSDVTMIYVPCYLDGRDGIFNKTYYELLPGLDATVFASYYEPWGYTPLESIAFGVPTITTSLAGFGQWVLSEFENSIDACGVVVEKRTDTNYSTAVGDIATDLLDLITASAAEIALVRKKAMETAARAEWSDFEKYYDEAYQKALDAALIRNTESVYQ